MPKFEVSLYNKDVRKANQQGDQHELYEDSWSDLHYVETNAPDEAAARARIEKQYPSHRGFVIENVSQVMPED